ncbi:hypothetical protein FIBSPDRAFT_890216 [Athelia psychrophila]|uniref:CCHC-type domain-containing protein n=1 Tax=Athelia psychrophila TaxID=1759441 RepID=A0A166L4V5_9AGAM|nr:hypothetical protein FIBSPDRAFT_890216 [Fibularhizoctonia sp. CBS 109695]
MLHIRFANTASVMNTDEYSDYSSSQSGADDVEEYHYSSDPDRLAVNSIRIQQADNALASASGVPQSDDEESLENLGFFEKEKWVREPSPERAEPYRAGYEEYDNDAAAAQIQFDAELALQIQAKESADQVKLLARQNASLKRKLERALLVPASRNSVQRGTLDEGVDSSRTFRSSATPAQASDALPVNSTLYQAIVGSPRKSRQSRPQKKAADIPGDSDPSDLSNSSSDDSLSSVRGAFPKQPESDHEDDSNSVKKAKSKARRDHRSRLEIMKYQQSFLKPTLPEIYKGEADADTFEKYSDQCHDYAKVAFMDSAQAVKLAGSRCSGDAYRFYESEVRRGKKKFTLTEFLRGMFDYVFPANFRTSQRILFESQVQRRGQKSVDFLRRLQTIARSAGDVSKREIMRHFWRYGYNRGVAKLISWKLDEHSAKLQTVLEEVVTAEQIIEKEGSTQDSERSRTASRYPQKAEKVPEKRDEPRGSASHQGGTPTRGFRPPGTVPGSSAGQRRDSRKPDTKSFGPSKRLDEATMTKLRDEGLCFTCRKPGHIGRDCPGSRSVKPPGLRVNAVAFTDADARLSALDEGGRLGLFAARPVFGNMQGSDSTPDSFSLSEGEEAVPGLEDIGPPFLSEGEDEALPPMRPKWADVPEHWLHRDGSDMVTHEWGIRSDLLDLYLHMDEITTAVVIPADPIDYNNIAHPKFEVVSWFCLNNKMKQLGMYKLNLYDEPEAFIPDEVLGDEKRTDCNNVWLSAFEWHLPATCYDSEDSRHWDGDGDEFASDEDDSYLLTHPSNQEMGFRFGLSSKFGFR